MHGIMEQLRHEPPDAIAGTDVTGMKDYIHPERTHLPYADVLEFHLENLDRLIIRPSGTEPKIKVYVFAQRTSRAESEESAAILANAAEQLIRGI